MGRERVGPISLTFWGGGGGGGGRGGGKGWVQQPVEGKEGTERVRGKKGDGRYGMGDYGQGGKVRVVTVSFRHLREHG